MLLILAIKLLAAKLNTFTYTQHISSAEVWPSVLVLAGAELICFTVAGVGVCFGFVLEHRVDDKEVFLLLLSWAYNRAKAFSAFLAATLARRLGVHGCDPLFAALPFLESVGNWTCQSARNNNHAIHVNSKFFKCLAKGSQSTSSASLPDRALFSVLWI